MQVPRRLCQIGDRHLFCQSESTTSRRIAPKTSEFAGLIALAGNRRLAQIQLT
jgi:hypothetical protein